MRRFFTLLLTLALTATLIGCSGTGTQNSSQSSQENPSESGGSVPSVSDGAQAHAGDETAKVLVAYFSATGNTEGIALTLQTLLGADLYEIVPEIPYTGDDLNYSDDDCRANQEQNDPAAQPAISGMLEHPEEYDVVFLGYPIWWGQAPKIIDTFLESYDFGNASIVPFCTSGSSGIDGSLEALHALAPEANWLEGQRFSAGADSEELAQWVEDLGFPGISAGID